MVCPYTVSRDTGNYRPLLVTNTSREIEMRRIRTDESLARVMARMKVTRDRTTYRRYGRRKGGWSRRMDCTAGIVK